eukprot:scaffold290210_cov18-Tisochrysis_lutea.AAC.1
MLLNVCSGTWRIARPAQHKCIADMTLRMDFLFQNCFHNPDNLQEKNLKSSSSGWCCQPPSKSPMAFFLLKKV